MAHECTTPDLGRIKKVGLFLLDDCLAPVYGVAAGFLDDCPAAFESSDNVDAGEDFTRRCANGEIRRFIKGVPSLQDIEVNVDFHWLDPDWISQAGGAQPIIHDGEVVGWSDCTSDRFNVAVVVWQEILGVDGCDPNSTDLCKDYVRIYPLKNARVTEEGTVGGEDGVVRITGSTDASNNLGSGPVELFCEPLTGDAAWATDCFPTGCHRFKFIGGPAPEGCGSFDTVEPPEPCVAAS